MPLLPLSPPPSAAAIAPPSATVCRIMSSDEEVKVVVSWEALLKQSPVYKSVLNIFSGKAHKAPLLDVKRTMLLNIISWPWEEYFLHGSSQADDFMALKKQSYAGWTSVSNCARVWTVPYTAKKLTPLLVLRDQVDSEKKISASPHGGVAPMNALKRAFKDLITAYAKSLASYHKTKRAEASKSICLPTLDHQLTGPLLQYKFPWNKLNRDPSACPCCGHSFTMPVELLANVNAKNREQRTKVSANGGDRKFNAVSATHGCYAYFHNCHGHVSGFGCNECERKVADGVVAWERGPGVCGFDCKVCTFDCRCVFQEHNRQKICIGIGREKRRLEDQGNLKSNSNPSPAEMGAMVWTQFIMTEIKNRNVHEHQHIDGQTSHELLQEISSLASYDVYMNCNHLVAPAAAAATVSVASSMRKRVMKRAGDIFFSKDDGAASLATKKAAGKVCASLSWEDAAYTLIVDNYETELNLQDIFKYCLEQETLEG
jgi:hypothetical protein